MALKQGLGSTEWQQCWICSTTQSVELTAQAAALADCKVESAHFTAHSCAEQLYDQYSVMLLTWPHTLLRRQLAFTVAHRRVYMSSLGASMRARTVCAHCRAVSIHVILLIAR
jgi:hypothetical protein